MIAQRTFFTISEVAHLSIPIFVFIYAAPANAQFRLNIVQTQYKETANIINSVIIPKIYNNLKTAKINSEPCKYVKGKYLITI